MRPPCASVPARPTQLRILLALLLAILMVTSHLMIVPATSAFADGDKDDKIKERDEVDSRLDDVRADLEGVNSDLADTYLDLAETEDEIPKAQAALKDAQDELAEAEEEDRKTGERLTEAQDEEKELTTQVDEGKEEVDSSNDQLDEAALASYKGSGVPNPTSVYVGNEKPQDAVDRSMNYKLTLEAQGTRLDGLRSEQAVTENSADRLEAVREEITDLKAKSEAAVKRKEKAEKAAKEKKQELDDLYAKQKKQKADLETKKTKYEDEETDLENRSSTLDTEIEKLAKEEKERLAKEAAAKKKEESSSSGSSGSSGSSSSSSSSSSGFIRPVGGALGSSYGWRIHPVYGTRKLHAGQDFPVNCGTPVKATASGRVLSTPYTTGGGNKVILSHGMSNGKVITSSYHHLQSQAVSPGQSVSQGDVVGYVGTTGSSTGCHLHFEIQEDGNSVDPIGYTG
jgi:murein DD-endopeptidase MepM/ murein hydrolase activator NlpD